jgi:hypothetical protein
MSRRTGGFALTVILLSLFAGAGQARTALAQEGSPFHTTTCPIPAGVQGYPVTVRAVDPGEMGPSYAAALAEAAARRWLVPSPRRRDYVAPGERISRTVPPEPRWADEWQPMARHVARIAATLYRDGRRPSARVVSASGDTLFDASLGSIFGDSPHDHPLPPFPVAITADSVQVIVGLGETPDSAAAGVARFAAQQRPARMTTRPRITAPPLDGPRAPRFARVKYDVDADGRIGQVEVLATSDPGFASAVRAGLRQARFAPPQSNCRPISQTMVQNFGGPGVELR